jgi:hypothetical protein
MFEKRESCASTAVSGDPGLSKEICLSQPIHVDELVCDRVKETATVVLGRERFDSF